MNHAIAALRRLEPDAVDRFYREHAQSVLGWVIRLGGPRIDAEDVAHQVFEVALKRLPSFRGDSAVRTWLYGVTRRVVANARRRAAFWSFVSLDGAFARADPGESPEVTSHRSQQRRIVQEALEDLTFTGREVVVLVDLEERAATEVAVMLGVPVGTIYSRLHHARRAFAAALARRGVSAELVHLGGAA
jgi:RNA polymerase sigma-70 factor, ECF subfamily